ncbi:hypothetical protein GOP47_0002189 [Adiantum capillus-veneris]|uniref:Alpha/beta hydrolase fold-3 domain-containing protein n=1 Tax=Adiantum capillus-veneris TaxID=13818 RepID=A0A9D4VB29_ADICA|nr:hypothetical protein GOP47_0002189 [Adiantum capillus-veneris]
MELPWQRRLTLKVRNWLVVRSDGSSNLRMASLLDRLVPAQTKQGVAAQDVVIDDNTGVWVRVFRPVEEGSGQQRPVMFYFHGGGFCMFSANSQFADCFGRYLSRTYGAIVVSVDYRKTPKHRYPAAYEDCEAALRWAVGKLQVGDLSRCVLVGESAGGNIVHHVACRAAFDPALEGRLKVVGNVALFPFFGGEERTEGEIELSNAPMLNYIMADRAWYDFLPAGANRDHPAANVLAPGAPDLRSIPLGPFFVCAGDRDCLKDYQVRYAEALRELGKEVQFKMYKGGIHCFHVFPEIKLTAQLLSDLQGFVRSRLSHES